MNTKAYNLIYIFFLLLAVSANAQNDTVLYHSFSSNCAVPPLGWTIQNVDGSCTWRCSDGGITQNNHTSQGCANTAANDWLISPRLALNDFKNEILNFSTGTQFSGGAISIQYSTNYPGSGSPLLSTWNPISATFPGASGNISLSGIAADSVYIAFQYTSSGNATGQAARWTVFDIIIKGTKGVSIANPASRNIDSTVAILGAEVKQAGNSSIVERGIIWSTSANPTLLSPGVNKIIKSGTLGVFDTLVSGLPSGTQIYFKGYAFNTTDTAYTGNTSFYTLATQPAVHVTNFTATTISNRSIVLNWTPSATANGYLILQKIAAVPLAVPTDAIAYNQGDILGDAIVADTIYPGAANTDTISNLLTGTRYHFSIVPFNSNNNAATLNYLTAPVIPTANDSTWGAPYASKSDIHMIAGSESNGIPSIQNTATITTATEGEAVLKLAFRDGGNTLIDADDMPTIFTGFTLDAGISNTISNWQTIIQSAALFNDSTGNKIGTITVNAGRLIITGLNVVAADNNYTTATLRLSLKQTSPLTDKAVFHFMLSDSTVHTQSIFNSSQLSAFYTSSDSLKNQIRVSATKIRITQQPPAIIEAGTTSPAVLVELTDVYNNIDLDTSLAISVTASGSNLAGAPVMQNPVSGKVTFNNLVFTLALDPDTLLITAGNLPVAKSSKFKVRNSGGSEIIATAGFAYTSNIPYQLYTDTAQLNLTNAVPVFGITIRDGGASGDADAAATVVTSLKFTLTNFLQVKTLALFDTTNTRLGEVIVTGSTVQFSGLNIATPDNAGTKLIVAATFRKQVTDNLRIQLKVTEALSRPDTACSVFQAVDAGGATSSSYINENKISVTGTKLRFVQQPSNVAAGAVVFPVVTVEAIDTNNNRDNDGRIVSVVTNKSSFTTSATTQAATSLSTGRASFDNLIFSDTATQVMLTVSDGTLSVTSDTFDIFQPVWYRSLKTGDWDSLTTWEYSIDTGNTWLPSPSEIPYALKHGKILIRSGHTVTMRGTTAASRTIDETTIEANATLILPINLDQQATVNDGYGTDLTIYGTLKQVNNNISGGIAFEPSALATVMQDGTVELAANGYATNWAGNPHFNFENGSVYLHNTSQTNSIGSGTFFPNAGAAIIPVFKIGTGITYPAALSNPQADLIINGALEMNAGKTFTVAGNATAYIRNGIKGAGNLTVSDNAVVFITANAEISGTGTIRINDNGLLELTTGSTVSLLSDKNIYTNNNRILSVKGMLNTYSNSFNGTASVTIEDEGTLVTAHINGVKESLKTSGNIVMTNESSLIFNNNTTRQSLNAPSHASAGNVTINNPFGVLLNDSFTIHHSLDLASGSLYTEAAGLLELSPGASVTNTTIDHFISGRVLTTLTQNTLVPVGKNTVYAPVTLAIGNNDSATFVIEYFPSVPASLDTTAKGGTLKRITTGNLWYINQVSGGSPVTISAAHQTPLLAGENLEDIRLVTWNNNAWTSVGPLTRNASAGMITSDPLTPSGYFTIGIDSACTTPAAPVVVATNICNGTAATLTATISSGKVKWYTTAFGGTPIFEGNIFTTGNLYHDSDLYAEAVQLSCASPRVKTTIHVVPFLAAPLAQQSLVTVCKNTPASLSVAAAGSISWYTSASSVNSIASGTVFNTGALTSDTLFYAATQHDGCLSERTPVEINVKTPPQQPYTQNIAVCKGNTATLLASSNQSLRWYSNNSTTQSFSSANYITLNHLESDTTLYVEAFDGTCASTRVAVNATTLAVPQAPQLQTPGFVCSGNALTLEAISTDSIRWYYAELDSLPAHTGNAFSTGILNRNTIFFADAFNGSCPSAKLSIPVSVVTKPAGFSLSLPSTITRNDSALVQLDGPSANEYVWNFGPDALTPVKTGRGPHFVQWHTIGTKTISVTTINKLGTFGCETTYDTTLNVSPATGLSEETALDASLFNVYPNPASDELNIRLTLKHNSSGAIRLTDLLGRTQWEDKINHAIYENTIPVAQFSQGMYTLTVEVNGERITQKIIITKQ